MEHLIQVDKHFFPFNFYQSSVDSSGYVEAANAVGHHLKIPTFNIDQLIYQALIENFNLATVKVNEVINQEFLECASESDLLVLPEEGKFFQACFEIF